MDGAALRKSVFCEFDRRENELWLYTGLTFECAAGDDSNGCLIVTLSFWIWNVDLGRQRRIVGVGLVELIGKSLVLRLQTTTIR